MSLPKLYSLWSASSFVLSVNNLRGGFHHHDPHLTIRKSRANEAAPELELSPVNLSCHRQHTLDIKLFEWDFMGSWSHTMARKFCSCFGILLWQRVLSEDPHKLEKKKSQQQTQHYSFGKGRTLLLGSYWTCEQENIKITTLQHLLLWNVKWSPVWPSGLCVSRMRIDSFVPCCELIFLVMKCCVCLFSLICQETAFPLVALCIRVSCLFH